MIFAYNRNVLNSRLYGPVSHPNTELDIRQAETEERFTFVISYNHLQLVAAI